MGGNQESNNSTLGFLHGVGERPETRFHAVVVRGKQLSISDRPTAVEDPALPSAELETKVTAAESPRNGEADTRVPGLTLLGHPDWSRVGEVLPLPHLALGKAVKVSRLKPLFARPGQPSTEPLAVAHLSREPLRLAAGAAPGSVTIDLAASPTPVRADGEEVDGRRTFSADEVEKGVVLELGHRVVLLLHSMPQRWPMGTSNPDPMEHGLIGHSEEMIRLRHEIDRVAGLDVSVLLQGQTGTGKELVAQALHRAGPRRSQPFVAVNVATLTPSLAAAELFGSAKGSFTGADRNRLGFFRKAEGGTLFLDEIGEAPPEIQVLLLRALETGEVIPVGSATPIRVDVRVVAATDADLSSAMAENRFRAPLFHRLAGYSIKVPALGQRREDLGRLLFYFLEQETQRLALAPSVAQGRPWPSSRTVARLAQARWPGNVRQLRNVARRLVVLGSGVTDPSLEDLDLAADGLAAEVPQPAASPPPPKARAAKLHRRPKDIGDEELLTALRYNGWRLKPTAAQLRVSRTSLYALIDRCPDIRRAGDIASDELEASLRRHGGDLVAMSAELEVSSQGLRHRLQELGLTLS